jgi:hypothetical protein
MLRILVRIVEGIIAIHHCEGTILISSEELRFARAVPSAEEKVVQMWQAS